MPTQTNRFTLPNRREVNETFVDLRYAKFELCKLVDKLIQPVRFEFICLFNRLQLSCIVVVLSTFAAASNKVVKSLPRLADLS